MAKHKHDDECLEVVARSHVAYELHQMGAMSKPAIWGEPARLAGVALLEAYLIHVRNLDEFLTRRRARWPELVVANHYFDDPWTPPTCLDRADLDHISRKIAHIYCDREDGFDWSAEGVLPRFAHWILHVFEHDFLASLRALHPARAAWFDHGLANAHTALAAADAGITFARVVLGPLGEPQPLI
jgi:hypothetical protein